MYASQSYGPTAASLGGHQQWQSNQMTFGNTSASLLNSTIGANPPSPIHPTGGQAVHNIFAMGAATSAIPPSTTINNSALGGLSSFHPQGQSLQRFGAVSPQFDPAGPSGQLRAGTGELSAQAGRTPLATMNVAPQPFNSHATNGGAPPPPPNSAAPPRRHQFPPIALPGANLHQSISGNNYSANPPATYTRRHPSLAAAPPTSSMHQTGNNGVGSFVGGASAAGNTFGFEGESEGSYMMAGVHRQQFNSDRKPQPKVTAAPSVQISPPAPPMDLAAGPPGGTAGNFVGRSAAASRPAPGASLLHSQSSPSGPHYRPPQFPVPHQTVGSGCFDTTFETCVNPILSSGGVNADTGAPSSQHHQPAELEALIQQLVDTAPADAAGLANLLGSALAAGAATAAGPQGFSLNGPTGMPPPPPMPSDSLLLGLSSPGLKDVPQQFEAAPPLWPPLQQTISDAQDRAALMMSQNPGTTVHSFLPAPSLQSERNSFSGQQQPPASTATGLIALAAAAASSQEGLGLPSSNGMGTMDPNISLSDLYSLLGPDYCTALAPQLVDIIGGQGATGNSITQVHETPLHPFEKLKLPTAPRASPHISATSPQPGTGEGFGNRITSPGIQPSGGRELTDGGAFTMPPPGLLSPPPPPSSATGAHNSRTPRASSRMPPDLVSTPFAFNSRSPPLNGHHPDFPPTGGTGGAGSDYSRSGSVPRRASQGLASGQSSAGGASSSRKSGRGASNLKGGSSGLLSRLHLLNVADDDSDDLFDIDDDEDLSDSSAAGASDTPVLPNNQDLSKGGAERSSPPKAPGWKEDAAGLSSSALRAQHGVQLSHLQAAGTAASEATNNPGSKSSGGGSPHSVCPSSLACRKRLTMSANRGCQQVREIIGALRYHIAQGDWDSALAATLYFCCCSDKLIPKPEGASIPEDGDRCNCAASAECCAKKGCIEKKQHVHSKSLNANEVASSAASNPPIDEERDTDGETRPNGYSDAATGSSVESVDKSSRDDTASLIATSHTEPSKISTDQSTQTSPKPRPNSRDWTAKIKGGVIKKASGVCCECHQEIYYPSIWTALRVSPAHLMNYDDFAMLCASLFHRVSVRQPGQPPIVYPVQLPTGHPVETLSKGAKEIRQVICDVQTLLLMCMASKVDLQPCEQLRLKNLAASTLYSLVWHPHILEALAPVFFQLSGQSPNDCFCSFLIHWGGTGVLQLIFEVFLLVLVKRARWRAALWLLSCTAIGENLLLPAICLIDAENQEAFLPEAANIIRCRCEILARLRFPAGAVTDIILDLSTYLSGDRQFHDQPWPFKAQANELILSLLPIVLGKTFSDDLLVYRGWHDRARGTCPVASYAPSDMYEYLRVQILNPEGERKLLSEDDLHMDRALDEAIPAYVFLGDPQLKEEYLALLPSAGMPRMMDDRVNNCLKGWKPSDPSILTPQELLLLPNHSCGLPVDHEELLYDSYLYSEGLIGLFRSLPDHPEAMERCLSVVELAARICEIYFVQSKSQYSSAFDEVTENNTRESLLQMSKRTVGELTGCTLGRVDLCYLRLLESYETIYGVPSQLSGLVGPRKHFLPCLNMSLLMHQLTLEPLVESGIPRLPRGLGPTTMTGATIVGTARTTSATKPHALCNSAICNNWQASIRGTEDPKNDSIGPSAPSSEASSPAFPGDAIAGSPVPGAASISPPPTTATSPPAGPQEGFTFPTFLPPHVARLLPAWLSTRTHAQPHTENQRWGLDGWQILAREIMVAASRTLGRFPTHPKVAPHLNGKLLLMFLLLYTEAGNPRAVHLLTRFACAAKDPECRDKVIGFFVQVLERAKRSKFVLVADAVAQITLFSSADPLAVKLAKLVMEVYIEAGDGVRAARHLESVKCEECLKVLEPYREQALQLQAVSQSGDGKTGKTAQKQFTKESRLRGFLAVVKNLQVANDVEGAVRYFYELRDSPGGILDISVANKILHLCVTYGRLDWAEQILQVLRSDAHCEINGIDFIPGACVRPDVVTCNIIIKGLARCKPPRIEDIDRAIQHMEQPFHLGGDGVKVDQVTIHTAINAAVQCGKLEKAWEYLKMLKKRQIKIDGFTCSTLVRQLGNHPNPGLLEDVASLVESLEFEDPVLLSSMIEIYSKQGEPGRMKKMLDKYYQRVSEPTPYAVAVMIKGYGSCGRFSKAVNLWKKLEERNDVRWSPCILSCVIEAFLSNGQLHYALKISDLARSVNIVFEEAQLSSLIRLCLSHQRFGEALKLYKYMREHDMNPCDVTYNNLMHTCVQAGDLETATDILNDMVENSHSAPDIITYSTIIKGLCDRGVMDSAIELFRSLPARNLKPDIVTYNTILEGYAKVGDQQKVESMFQELVSNGVKPTCFTLTILVKFYGRKCMIDTVLELVKTLPKVYKFKMDTFVFTASIAACAWNGRLKEAIEFLEAMRETFGASARTYGTLIAGSVRNQQWWYLSKVLLSAAEDKVQLERRDVHVLRDVLQLWTNGRISEQWLASGFNQSAAEQLRSFIATQKKRK